MKLHLVLISTYLFLSAMAGAQAAETSGPSSRIVTVTWRPVPRIIETIGAVKAVQRVSVSSRLQATVSTVSVHEGDRLRAGQLLATLDDRDPRARMNLATAALDEAKSALVENQASIAAAQSAVRAAQAHKKLAVLKLSRSNKLLGSKAVPRQEVDEAVAAEAAGTAEVERALAMQELEKARRLQVLARITRAEAEVTMARLTLDYTLLRAPMDGLVISRNAEVGNLASPGGVLFEIDSTRYRFETAIPETEIEGLVPGTEASVSVDALSREVLGKIAEVVPAIDTGSRTFLVKVALDEVPGLRSGLYGRCRFRRGEELVLSVPIAAVLERGQLHYVMALDENGTAARRLVQVGVASQGWIEILSGLVAGDRVAVPLEAPRSLESR